MKSNRLVVLLVLLGATLIALKLAGELAWAWVWVLLPLWALPAFAFGMVGIIMVAIVLAGVIGAIVSGPPAGKQNKP